jgi:antitoxin CptB
MERHERESILSYVTAPLGRADQEAHDALRRKLIFRAWRRGTSEADMLISAFADRRLPDFLGEELHQFERLMEEYDPVIDDWVTGRQSVPKEHDNKVMMLLREFRSLRTIGDRSRS